MSSDTKILIVEDDVEINKMLKLFMENEGYKAISAFSGSEALMCIEKNEVDIILLDLMIPGISGEEAILKIRNMTNVPVIVISAKTSKETKIELLNNGADDFICKPFEIEEVIARVKSNLRRYFEFKSKDKEDNNILKFKDIILDTQNKSVFVNNKPIKSTAREILILELLLSHPNKIYSKANIFESVWGEEFLGDDNTVNVHMSRIRNKLNCANKNEDYIETIWGMGYRLKK